MGHNRKIMLFELARDAGPGYKGPTRVTYFNLSSPRFSHSRLFTTLGLFSSLLPLLPRLHLCLFFFLSLSRLAVTTALLHLFGFCAAASVILIASFLRSLLDCYSHILREKLERDYSNLTVLSYRRYLHAARCLSSLLSTTSVSVIAFSAGGIDPRR
ncbi:hypothetical protein M9H77_06343 [Catharanthus roseus]|uniref:Uncharacterized protein n=1 Tax=Catharanthus roseus TaxID=4058 RepID=A0ACC0BS06_CATRO|nr:hypothetical protein M9H77_06343 [Catharanthus roseus]